MKNKETLFVVKSWAGETIYLKDSKQNHIGAFNSVDDAQDWCNVNNYTLSRIYLPKPFPKK